MNKIIKYNFSNVVKNIQKVNIYFEDDYLYCFLKHPQTSKLKKIIINSEFELQMLENIFKIEIPSNDIVFYEKISNTLLSNEIKFNQFFENEKEMILQMKIDDNYTIEIPNMKSSMNNSINETINNEIEDPNSNLGKFERLKNSKIDDNILKNYIILDNKFKSNLKEFNKNNLTIEEINELLNASIQKLKTKNIILAQDLNNELNDINSEIDLLNQEKNDIFRSANSRSRFYIYLIFLLSIAQFCIFYYMIYNVEYLGWDIVEPITYSVFSLSMLIGLRFYQRNKLNRNFSSITKVFQNNFLKRNLNKQYRINNINNDLEYLKKKSNKLVKTIKLFD